MKILLLQKFEMYQRSIENLKAIALTLLLLFTIATAFRNTTNSENRLKISAIAFPLSVSKIRTPCILTIGGRSIEKGNDYRDDWKMVNPECININKSRFQT